MTVFYHAGRSSLTARTDEDIAMSSESYGERNEQNFAAMRDALYEAMMKEAAYLRKNYGPDAFYIVSRNNERLLGRANDIAAQAAKVFALTGSEFDAEKTWSALEFVADNIQFKIVRVEREVKA